MVICFILRLFLIDVCTSLLCKLIRFHLHEHKVYCIIKLIIYISTTFFYLYIRLHVSTDQSVIFRPTLKTKSLVLCARWDPNMFTLIKYIKSGKFLCWGRMKYVLRTYLPYILNNRALLTYIINLIIQSFESFVLPSFNKVYCNIMHCGSITNNYQ